jgi:hypothetical protein
VILREYIPQIQIVEVGMPVAKYDQLLLKNNRSTQAVGTWKR